MVLATAGCLTLAGAAKAQSANEAASSSALGMLGTLLPPRSAGYLGNSGSALELLPIVSAPGRRHVDPNLTFVYGSLGSEGSLGLGWSLEIGSISRSSSRGIPAESQVDEFVISLAGSGETLVPLGGGAYRPRFETTYRTYQFVVDHWEVRDSQGFFFRFGGDSSSRIDGLQWMLDLVTDANGNQMSVKYTTDHGYLYPSEIDYTGYQPTGDAGADKITFDYENRPDQTTSYALGPQQSRQLRLSRVSNYANGNLVRRYSISYTQSPTTNRSLISAIDIVGDDDTTSLHARSYAYQTGAVNFLSTGPSQPFPVSTYDSNGHDTGTRFSDVDGDGFMDVVDNGENVWLGEELGLVGQPESHGPHVRGLQQRRYRNASLRHRRGHAPRSDRRELVEGSSLPKHGQRLGRDHVGRAGLHHGSGQRTRDGDDAGSVHDLRRWLQRRRSRAE
jgi:hypothetical protein